MFTLPDVLGVQHTAVRGGDLVLLGQDRHGRDDGHALVWVGGADVRTIPLGEGSSRHDPSLLAHPAGGVVVVWDFEHVVHVAGPDAPVVPLVVKGAELLAGVRPALHGGSAVSDEARWHVVLSDGLLVADLRYAAPLAVDLASGTATWESAPWALDPTEFPRDLNGLVDHDPHVSIGATLLRDGVLHACSAGSDIRGTSRGADFFSCVRVTPDGHVVEAVHEHHGWKRDGRKHGILARFTADGTYAVLTPVFRTGGHPYVVRLADGAVLTPNLPRGLAGAKVLDHHPDRGWWLRLDRTVTVIPALFD